ncbi:U32 family peptidase [Paenibacillus sp. N1-5-1-14]|uniref:peptidase U32 family protein n=1 Tax=Paenibacillus radicibacter TaxID=2972488 RepID=UPI0021599EA7|nr:U32 family peptidase [Paenibacillus radicibacter]MCR8645275.1 U32 family peptidase [Paenibacillus radicibacter]
MARYFNGKEVELLAPVGTFDIFETIIHTNCDAVYLGGPSLNMRMMRKGYNFSYEEIEKAIEIAHGLDKRVYITVNNLLNECDLDEAQTYFQFLDRVQPDAIISQDFAVFKLIKEMNLNINVHSSVMMNVHNLEMIELLKELGVTRVVTSRELDLQTIKTLQQATGMEIEYFVHGDMCTVNGSNCFTSSMMFGFSSNRGKCLKPCRWEYRIKRDGYVYPTEYPLAAKDMYMYEHIPELIDAHITSFKIEGRMRDKEFLTMLVNSYGEAIDRYIEDPIGYNRIQDRDLLTENRKRDFSTAFAFGKPGLSNINRRYEGTGKFYSTGKVFSTPTEEREISEDRIAKVKEILSENTSKRDVKAAELSVRVNNMEQAKMAIEEGVHHIYLSGDVFLPDLPFTKKDVEELTAMKAGSKIYLGMPRMMNELQFDQYDQLLANNKLDLDGLLVTNSGAVRKFKKYGYPLVGDFNLNIFNHLAAEQYAEFGVERLVTSLELPTDNLKALLESSTVPLEMVVHGSPVTMYLEHDLYENTEVMQAIAEEDNKFVDNDYLVLLTDKGENPVYRDHHGKNHLTLAKELNYLPLLRELNQVGATHFRIEGCTYKTEQLRTVVQAYMKALGSIEKCDQIYAEMEPVYAGYTLGTLQF